MALATPLPTGTVTFLFTDIEGSTRLLQSVGAVYGTVLEEHRQLIRSIGAANGGIDFGSEGDALFLAFTSAPAAVATAVESQRALAGHEWPEGVQLRVRMAVHTGEATLVGDNYVGLDLHRVARIVSAGHGGQILVSDATLRLAGDALPPGTTARDMGERRLKDLSRPEHLFQLVIDGLPGEFPALRTLDTTRNNLPTQLTSFVGRSREVATARGLLEHTRLLTLTGPGGTGKTRLSLQVAAEVAEGFPGGTFFVPLDAISDPDLVSSAIATCLTLQEAGLRTPRERLLDFVKDRSVLLVLDNFEQVLDAAALVAEILRTSPASKVIVSSRAALRISGEQEYAVPPLGLLDGGAHGVAGREIGPTLDDIAASESVSLFVERATAVRSDFRLDERNARTILEICRRLDGLPLAIELAAARVKVLPPDAILSRLDQRLTILSSSARDLPERQQTLRGAIAWSYDLLDAGSRRLLARASVFAGGIDTGQAETVCGPAAEVGGDVFDGLSGLVDQSLLRQDESSGEPRFRMLQTIRDFAREKLGEDGEADEISRRHAAAFLALAVDAENHLTGPDQRAWLDRLERENDNFRVALEWIIARDEAVTGERLAGALWRYWQMRGYLEEGFGWTTTILALPEAHADPVARRSGLDAAAGLAYWRGDMAGAQPYYDESLALARASGDKRAIADALYNESFVFMITFDDVPRGQAMAEEALGLYQELGDPVGVAKALWCVGNAQYFRKDYAAAREMLLAAVAGWRAINDHFGLGWALHTLGLAQFRLGDSAAARHNWLEMLRIFAAADDVSGIANALSNFRALAAGAGHPVRALRLAGATDALVARTGVMLADLIAGVEGREGLESGMLEGEAARAAWAEGNAMPLTDAIAYALSDEEDEPGPDVGVTMGGDRTAMVTRDR